MQKDQGQANDTKNLDDKLNGTLMIIVKSKQTPLLSNYPFICFCSSSSSRSSYSIATHL